MSSQAYSRSCFSFVAFKIRVALAASLLIVSSQPHLSSQEATGIEAALPAIRQMNDPKVLLNALNGAAMQKMQSGDIDKAITFIDESIAIAREQGDPSQLNAPLMTATQILNRVSPQRATKFLLGVLGKESGNAEVERMILQRLGEHLQRSGDVVAAIQVFHDFQAKCREEDPKSEAMAWALLQYGQACLNGRMFDLAQPALAESKAIADSLERYEISAISSASLANACLGTEQFEMSIELFSDQLASAKQAKDKNAAFSAISGLVSALLANGQLEDASTVLTNNIPSSSGMLRGELLSHRAALEIVNSDASAALASSLLAAEARLSGIPLLARGMAGPASVMHDKLAQAYLHFRVGDSQQSLDAAAEAEQGYQQVSRQLEKAAQVGAVNADSALAGYSSLVASISDIRQQVLVQEGELEKALLEAEAGRGQAQIRAMQRLFKVDNSPAPASALDLEEIKQLAKDTESTFVEYSVVQPIDYLTLSRLGKSKARFQPRQIFAWIVTPDGQVHFENMQLEQPLDELVEQLRREIAPPKEPETEQSADQEDAASRAEETAEEDAPAKPTDVQHAAYTQLWHPIAKHLPQDPDKTIVIIPHAELFAVPFAALLDADSEPLIESHTIVTAGSIELFRLAFQRRRSAGKFDVKDVLVVGNPEMPSYRFRPDKPSAPLDPLPGSEKEAKTIASMFGIEPLIGSAASESAVTLKMKTAPVIHMATHGLLEADSIFARNYLSSLALAADEQADGFLTVREVMAMQLEAELAVLSACDSGRGKITGDGVVGLSRAFLSAGVPTVVVSLWPVSDQATAFMMVQFYKALGDGQSKAAALRTAILATRSEAPDPKLWAPFTLYGVGF